MMIRCRAGAAIRWLTDWPVRWRLRSSGLPDIPETRHLLRTAWRRGWTFGAAPSTKELLALHRQAAEVILRSPPDEDAQ